MHNAFSALLGADCRALSRRHNLERDSRTAGKEAEEASLLCANNPAGEKLLAAALNTR
ncbi:hypothetical protein [Bradyrhizobium valentinum]|nr:hypothetical protein [Bradyrhizobium valentinum]